MEGGGGQFLIRRVTILCCLEYTVNFNRFQNSSRLTYLKHKTKQDPFKDLPVPGPIVRSYLFYTISARKLSAEVMKFFK